MRKNDPSALPRWRRPGRRCAAAISLSAAALILAACSTAGTSAGGGSASGSLTPRQVLLAAATQAEQITSATETLAVKDSGASSSAMTATVRDPAEADPAGR
jgi:hypothetical protein